MSVGQVDRVRMTVARRLHASRGSVYEAFRRTGCGLDPDELEAWFMESPASQSFGDQAGKVFGCMLSAAMMAVESERETKRLGRWWTFR